MGKSKIQVSLRESLSTGEFGPIKLAMSDKEIATILGSPDCYGYPPDDADKAGIWKYGDIEFYFYGNRQVYLVYVDTFESYPIGGESIEFDPWIFRQGLLFADARKTLENEGIPYQVLNSRLDDGHRFLAVGSGFEFSFKVEEVDDGWPLGFSSFSLKECIPGDAWAYTGIPE